MPPLDSDEPEPFDAFIGRDTSAASNGGDEANPQAEIAFYLRHPDQAPFRFEDNK